MKMSLRLLLVAGFVILSLMGAASLSAAEPTGSNPEDGLAPTCTYQPIGAGASIWLKIPYRFDYRLQLTLDAYFVGGVEFDVYPSPTASDPMGTGTYNPNEPTHDLNWEGRLQQDGFIYVLVTNTNPFGVQYRFCVNEKEPYYSQGGGPAPVDCAAICASKEGFVCTRLQRSSLRCAASREGGCPVITTPEGCVCCMCGE